MFDHRPQGKRLEMALDHKGLWAWVESAVLESEVLELEAPESEALESEASESEALELEASESEATALVALEAKVPDHRNDFGMQLRAEIKAQHGGVSLSMWLYIWCVILQTSATS